MKKILAISILVLALAPISSVRATTTILPAVSQKHEIAVRATGYVTTAKDMQAIHHLGVDLSTPCRDGGNVYDGYLTRIDAVYPMLGSTQGAQKFNMKDPRDADAAYRLTEHGSPAPTHASTGVTFNGSSAYQDTHYVPSVASNSLIGTGLSVRNSVGTESTADMGVTSTGLKQLLFYIYWQDTHQYNYVNTTAANPFFNPIPPANTTGFWMQSRNNALSATNNVKVYRSGSLLQGYNEGASAIPTNSVYFGAYDQSGVATFGGTLPHRNKEWDFAIITNGLFSDTEQAHLYNAVASFNTTLGR